MNDHDRALEKVERAVAANHDLSTFEKRVIIVALHNLLRYDMQERPKTVKHRFGAVFLRKLEHFAQD